MENKQIASSFIAAKKAFNPALKDKTNPAYKSKYADLGACIEAVDDSFLANGIVMYQETFEDQSGVTVETVLLHESGEMIRCGRLHVPAAKNEPQGYGSALTYARRYSLMAACGIAPEDDDGNSASRKPKNQTLTDSAVADFVATISGSETMDVLKNAFAEAYRAAEIALDDKAKASFEKAKNERKQYFIDKEKKA